MALSLSNKKESSVSADVAALFKFWFFPFVSIAMSAVIGYFVIWPWVQDVLDKRDSIDVDKEKITALVKKVNVLNSANGEELTDYLLQLQIAVPRSASPANILGSIEQQVINSGMYLTNIHYAGISNASATASTSRAASTESESTSDTETSVVAPSEALRTVDSGEIHEVNQSGEVGVVVDLSGDYYQAVNLLRDLQETRPLFTITNFTISNTPQTLGDGTTTTHSMSLQLSSDFKMLIDNLGTASSPVESLTSSEIESIKEINKLSTLYDSTQTDEGPKFPEGKDNPF
ncbi:hypothetical protein KC614_01385 [candidate division WWE3 bacterium]|uniref:Uncharacterized protein n=1 Tax=candidate division WWE3 bacterium TaxID=2053526 RepID=A0A955RQP0_UNCKA|nr:hypothetical protein [candidate division WWE3 bacterium]